jgi:hypothetical protein
VTYEVSIFAAARHRIPTDLNVLEEVDDDLDA